MSSPDFKARILVVDDDLQSLDSTTRILEIGGYDALRSSNGVEALETIRHRSGIDVVVTDVRMPKMSGIEFLRAIRLFPEEIPVILMTAFGEVHSAVWAMKLGAVDFLTKPFKKGTLYSAIETALRRRSFRTLRSPSLNGKMLGQSNEIQKLRVSIEQIAKTKANVLLTGESGTGKEMAARMIHQSRFGEEKPFIALNCAALPSQLIEAELFGVEKGAYSGADQSRVGLFEAAEGGTLLLDEIGEMALELQPKLLRVLQDGEVRRLGSNQSRKTSVTVIAATNEDLKTAVEQKRFREDLLFRLDVVSLEIPPLRNRKEDIPMLASSFLRRLSSAQNSDGASKEIEVSDSALAALQAYSWPGNVRELANAMERAFVFSRTETIEISDLPAHIAASSSGGKFGESGKELSDSDFGFLSVPIGTPLREIEELVIRRTLDATSGDKSLAAKLLGVNSRTIYRKLEKSAKPKASDDIP